MKGNHNRRHLMLATLLGFGVISAPTQAEDIEVFFTKPANTVAPNVLFVLDTSGSMNETTNSASRIDVLKNSLQQVLKPTPAYKALNVGIMDFSGDRSGGIDFPITDINSDANLVDSGIPTGTDVGSVLDYITQSYTASGKTPMGDALYFISNYYSGDNVHNSGSWLGSRNLPAPTWDTLNNSYTGGNREADNPATYSGSIGYTDTPETRERYCSPSSPRPIRSCGATYSNCEDETNNISARPKQYRIRTYSCDSSGFECGWDSPSWKSVDAAYPGDGSCSGQPSSPQGGDAWVECRAARPASSYTYERCEEDYIYNKRVWDPAAIYNSPITHQCQSNYVVMLTDGEPTRRDTRNNIATRVVPVTNSTRGYYDRYKDCMDLSYLGTNISNNGRCLPELVEYMARYDQSPNQPNKQSVYTYTIGFKLSANKDAQDFLKLLAEKSKGAPADEGEGEYFDANSPSELVAVFKKIINEVTGDDVSFSAPSVGVDQKNRLATSEFLYRTEFSPSDKPRWSGDVVKTKLGRDSAGKPTFSDEANLADTLVADSRKIVTVTANDFDLSADKNRFKTSNTDLVNLFTGLGVSDPAKLIQWTLGTDVQDEDNDPNTDERKHMGDALHTTPAMVNYTNRQVLFVPTNEGLLHAFDVSGSSPTELFAFIPPSLLANLDTLYRNSNTDDKVYGLDANLAIWQDGNKVILYFGMRRGGRDYYALDVSDPTKPELLWHIEGGKIDPNKGDFTELGQTWSTPQITKVTDSNGTETMALVFGGGYDAKKQDDISVTTRTNDTVGRGIFVVNATTGTIMWSADPNNLGLSNSIPSDVRIIDLDGNGLADRLYVGDTGSRIWRIDLDQTNISNSSGYQLADFNGGTAAGNRRFYYAPSIAFDRKQRLMVAIGSGYRAHPAEAVTEDRFYVFEDKDSKIGKPTSTPSALTENKLGDITNDVTGQAAFTGNVIGWRLNMDPSQKVLAESVIFNNNVVFTTYKPDFQGSNTTCNLKGNIPRAYMLALEDGRPVRNLNGGASSGTFTLANRYQTLATVQFIPGSPYITFNKPDSSGSQGTGPLIGGDKQTADLYVGKDLVDSDSFLTDRISWQNQ